MLNFDFTARLLATLPGVPRNQVVKFNNSWLQIGLAGTIARYLVVYRAMVHKVGGPVWAFANPPPTHPGQAGTPWGSGWGFPDGQATLEGQVPDGRGGRYFDGIGVAEVTLDIANLGNLAVAFNVVNDYILPDSDGYEDPRIFSADGRFFIHSHRYQPDSFRNVPGPHHRIYGGYTPARLPFTPGDITTPNRALFVKITELEFRNNLPHLGAEFYYGSNVSDRIEKNYGFFMDGDTLCAVYGVAPNSRPFTVLRAVRGLGGQAVHQFPRGRRFLVEEFQPNTDPATNNQRDCFVRILQYYSDHIPGPINTVFSSSGPLIWNGGLNRWQGVGHVKILYQRIFDFNFQLADAALDVAQQPAFAGPVPADRNAAYDALINDDAFVDAVNNYLTGNPNDVRPQVAAYLGIPLGNVTMADRDKFIAALRHQLVRGSLCRLVVRAMQIPHTNPWAGNLLPNPAPGGQAIFHPTCFYLSFFFELEAGTYQLHRFSNAFLVYDAANPHFLQFASNLTPVGADYLMSFGEDDNRTKAFQLTAVDYQGLVYHDAINFNPANYMFRRIDVPEQVL
ncbi:hypothetical protein FKG94_14230 [Exilibacterium tricleocarpae]|uniref:Uncharacterized protein n=1 Tax=Exilibacterium tricleocarpae TaxID=2591008 RepID=A0A545TLW4_9GAMM|nr:hypothetical protein [Exilibacterium tricleocarpae]TQV78222.1 hypothetical protein FKG94_14230 [Exilibacterium tricleocarpae]